VSHKIHLSFLFLLSLLLYSCRRPIALPETVEAHYIQYNIDYLENMAGDIPTRILPGKMESWYTEYFVVTKIEGFFNQFSLIQIADLKHKKVITLLNFFGNKVYYEGEKGELPAGIIAPAQLSFRTTGERSVIGGLNSEQVEVSANEEVFHIYFTKDFSVPRPNLSTPYGAIEHPLSDFRIQLSYLKMHLSCNMNESRMIESEIFMIPEEYRPVTRPLMEEIINSLFTKE